MANRSEPRENLIHTLNSKRNCFVTGERLTAEDVRASIRAGLEGSERTLVKNVAELKELIVEFVNTDSIYVPVTSRSKSGSGGTGTGSSIRYLLKPQMITLWEKISDVMNDLFNDLLGPPSAPDVFVITPTKRQRREFFVSVGGLDTLMLLFAPKGGEIYAAPIFERFHNTWNQLLVLLREVVFALPSLAVHHISTAHTHFLFHLLSHRTLFDGSVNLIEEILAIKSETIDLTQIPGVDKLFRGMNCRQLAVMCRVLALLLFEPEDRVAMENAHVS